MVPLFSRRIALIQRIFVSLSPAIPGIAVFCSLVFKTSRVTGARFEQIYGCKKWYQRGPLCRCSFVCFAAKQQQQHGRRRCWFVCLCLLLIRAAKQLQQQGRRNCNESMDVAVGAAISVSGVPAHARSDPTGVCACHAKTSGFQKLSFHANASGCTLAGVAKPCRTG